MMNLRRVVNHLKRLEAKIDELIAEQPEAEQPEAEQPEAEQPKPKQ